MASVTRREYWRQVRKGAWAHSKEAFSLTLTLVSIAIVVVLVWLIQGRQTAVDNYLKPEAFGIAAAVLVAIGTYCFNLFRAAADIYVEQMVAIQALDNSKSQMVETLRAEIAQLQAPPPPAPFALSFQQGVTPFEELFDGLVRRSSGTTELRQKRVLRVRVENPGVVDAYDVSVRLNFRPPRTRMNDLTLHIMNDNPPDDNFQQTFTLLAHDHKYVDIFYASSLENQSVQVFHVVRGLEREIPVGFHEVELSVHSRGRQPVRQRFSLTATGGQDAAPEMLLNEMPNP